MNRASFLYVLTFAVLAAGLWAVLRAGAKLKAPADISGYWEVDRQGPQPLGVGEGLQIEQSGRHFRLHLEAGRTLDLKLIEEAIVEEGADQRIRVQLGSDQYWVGAEGSLAKNVLHITLRGRSERSFTAHRTRYGDGRPVPVEEPQTAPVTLDDPIPVTQPVTRPVTRPVIPDADSQ